MNTVKRWLAGFLSFAMIFTSAAFTNVGALAVYAAENNATFIVETEGGSQEFTDIDTAAARVKKDGTITAKEGSEINKDFTFRESYGYTLDLTNATIAANVKIEPDDKDNACLIVDGKKYTYHPNHKFYKASAGTKEVDRSSNTSSPSGWTITPNVVVYCQYAEGHETAYTVTQTTVKNVKTEGDVWYKTDANGDPIITDGEYTLVYTFASTLPAAYKDLEGTDVEWQIPKTEKEHVYTLGEISYKHYNDGFAIVDADGKAQFEATYKDNNVVVNDETTGEPTTIKGTVKKVSSLTTPPATYYIPDSDYSIKDSAVAKTSFASDVPATANDYGTHSYEVVFTLPDNTEVKATICNVMDVEKTAGEKESVKRIDFRYVNSDGEEVWIPCNQTYATTRSITISGWNFGTGSLENGTTWTANGLDGRGIPKATVGNDDTYRLFDNDVTFAYRPVYNSTKIKAGDPEEIVGDAKELKLQLPNSTDKVYACGKASYASLTESFKAELAGEKIRTYSFTVSALTIAGDHSWETRSKWATETHVTNPADHDNEGTAYANCECGDGTENHSYDGITFKLKVDIPKTQDHEYATDDGEKEIEVEPTCQSYGFKYKKCSKGNSGWTPSNGEYVYELKDVNGKSIGTVSVTASATPNWHPVYVEGSKTKTIGDHTLFAYNVVWNNLENVTTDGKVDGTAKIDMMCSVCHQHYLYIYHTQTFAQSGVNKDELIEGSTNTTSRGAADRKSVV